MTSDEITALDFGSIDIGRLQRLAASSGITESELNRALEVRGMLDVAFCTASL